MSSRSSEASRASPPPSYLLDRRYLAVEPLACGETSEIFSGSDTWSGELVTVRILRADRPERGATFQRKAERLFGLSSSRVVRPIHLGEDRTGRPFLVTEHLVGRSVAALARVRWEVACEIARRASLAIGEMHLNDLFHGGVRASTLFIAAPGGAGARLKLLDLGVGARTASEAGDRMAVAAVLYTLITGTPPLPSPTRIALPDAPPELSEMLGEWLYRREGGASAADMATALRALVDPDGARDAPSERDSQIPETIVLA
jgi:serine/threonine protein kinase